MYSVVVESNHIEENVKTAFQNKEDIALSVSREGSSKKTLATCSHVGRIHLFKEKGDERASRIDVPSERTTLLCILAFPTDFELSALVNFFNPASYGVVHILYINSPSATNCAFIKFGSVKSACNFYLDYNGANFIDINNSIMPHICHTVFCRPLLFINDAAPVAIPDARTQLPACISCLEQLDTHVSGLLGVVCSHTFQCLCATRWSHCRQTCIPCNIYHQAEKGDVTTVSCTACSVSTNIWICLICGYIGCSRYENKHSYEHYLSANHSIALEKEVFRIWDYERDLYIHKVVNNDEQKVFEKTDAGFNSEANPGSKAIKSSNVISEIESRELLEASLQSQEYFFEKQIAELNTTKNARIILIEKNFAKILAQKEEAIGKLREIEDQKKIFEARKNELQAQIEGLANLQNDLLRENMERQKQQEEFKKIFQESQNQRLVTEEQKELRIKELQEEIRDLTIYIDASRKLKDATLLNNGDTITVKEPKVKTGPDLPLVSNSRPSSPNTNSGGKGKGKGGKGRKKGKK